MHQLNHNLNTSERYYPANSLFVSGYLTTPGQDSRDTWQMIADLGFEIQESPPVNGTAKARDESRKAEVTETQSGSER